MNKITFNEFTLLPIIAHKKLSESYFEVNNGGEIVHFVKAISRLIGVLRINKVDFLGCSASYVEEKIDLAIKDLQWMKNRIKEIDKRK